MQAFSNFSSYMLPLDDTLLYWFTGSSLKQLMTLISNAWQLFLMLKNKAYDKTLCCGMLTVFYLQKGGSSLQSVLKSFNYGRGLEISEYLLEVGGKELLSVKDQVGFGLFERAKLYMSVLPSTLWIKEVVLKRLPSKNKFYTASTLLCMCRMDRLASIMWLRIIGLHVLTSPSSLWKSEGLTSSRCLTMWVVVCSSCKNKKCSLH